MFKMMAPATAPTSTPVPPVKKDEDEKDEDEEKEDSVVEKDDIHDTY
jgi:hypothetical protein